MKVFSILLAAMLVAGAVIFQSFNPKVKTPDIKKAEKTVFFPKIKTTAFKANSVTSVDDVVSKALAFKALLSTAQQTTLQQTYTTSLARKWSNLPCGAGCRNGIEFNTLTTAQLTAALEVIAAASGTTANEGYDEFNQIRAADDVLNATAGGSTYSGGYYFISFLNTPSTTGTWMLQFGGHHNANNIAFNTGNVVGTTPMFEGIEPKSWTTGSVTYAPLAEEHDAMSAMLASLSASQLTTAKLSSTFSDVTMAPGETNGGTGTFPTTKLGIACSALNAAQTALVVAAMQPWLNDIDATSESTLNTLYQSGLDGTYISWTGSGTSGDASTFLIANTNYVRIDGPRIWIEFICQTGVVFPAQIHYHSVWRDHSSDYGADLSLTALPVKLAAFTAAVQNSERVISWTTSEEININHFEIENSATGNNFTKIGTVTATNTGNIKTYSFTDNISAPDAISYYRLKIVNNDGSFTYSSVALIQNRVIKTCTIFPNPASQQINVSTPVEMKNATIKIFSGDGQVVLLKNNITGLQTQVNIANLATGIYVIRVDNRGSTWLSKFSKQ